MKVLITEEQYNLYIRRRYPCMRDIIDKFLSGEKRIVFKDPTLASLIRNWESCQYLLTKMTRQFCDKETDGSFNEKIHNDIMELFGDDLYKIYELNKKG